MNLTLWTVQILLAITFIAAGAMKLVAYDKFKARTEKHGPSGITHGLATFIGLVELVGGVGIVLPMATNIAPALSAWAAAGLSIVMLLAVVYLVKRHESAVAPGIFFLLTAFVAAGRFLYGS